ncbi:hypothetical protein N789_04880 [Arenimonas oryziterrae DSM 21050 = YC6267]|uniref:DUF2007 domain-containing protein n=2 Tax=Arenimonas TaxID=490567 RepID=A0A091B9T5_9GAMM|nr:hypothetical protein N789_04880 [Arenimonas oryziterrae DSM 21050 = YC6267]
MFTSARFENVQRVADMLSEAGIENRIMGGPGYKGYSRRQFSYADKKAQAQETQASVWVIKSDDYKQARELMQDLGLLDKTDVPASYVPAPMQFADKPGADPAKRLMRIKVTMLFAMVVIVGGMMARAYLAR